MSEIRIEGIDSVIDIMSKLSEGNPGALVAMIEMYEKNPNIDPQDITKGLGPLLSLDSLGIYGTDIYILHSDICEKNVVHTLACLRAVQLGIFSGEVLKDACSRQDYSGKNLVPVEDLYKKVKNALVEFDR